MMPCASLSNIPAILTLPLCGYSENIANSWCSVISTGFPNVVFFYTKEKTGTLESFWTLHTMEQREGMSSDTFILLILALQIFATTWAWLKIIFKLYIHKFWCYCTQRVRHEAIWWIAVLLGSPFNTGNSAYVPVRGTSTDFVQKNKKNKDEKAVHRGEIVIEYDASFPSVFLSFQFNFLSGFCLWSTGNISLPSVDAVFIMRRKIKRTHSSLSGKPFLTKKTQTQTWGLCQVCNNMQIWF